MYNPERILLALHLALLGEMGCSTHANKVNSDLQTVNGEWDIAWASFLFFSVWYLHVHVSHISTFPEFDKWKLELTGNGDIGMVSAKGERKRQISSLSANGNGKQMFVFLDRQTKNGNLQLLFQQTCPSMSISGVRIAVLTVLTQHKGRLGRERICEAGETYSPRFTNCNSTLPENVHYRAETYTCYKTKR